MYQALWITVAAAASAAPGVYTGEIEVLQGGRVYARVTISARVRNFSIPETPALETAMGFADGPLRVAYPESWKSIRPQVQNLMRDYRLTLDAASSGDDDAPKGNSPSLQILDNADVYAGVVERWRKFLSGDASFDDLLKTAGDFSTTPDRWSTEISDYLRTQGKRVYWHVNGEVGGPYANFADCRRPPMEGRLLLGFQTHLFRADGFLFKEMNRWSASGRMVMDDADVFFPKWIADGQSHVPGDGVLLYPGKIRVFPSIRLAQLRDGVQDYEWLVLAERRYGRTAVDAVSRSVVRSLADTERNPAILARARAVLGDMIEASDAARPGDVPPRHVPRTVMWRDYWPALYRYGDWVRPLAERAVRFDNPEINNLPAFRDATPVYHGRRPPPPPESGMAVWGSFKDNFSDDERDKEILSSNPFPDRPLILWTTSKRNVVTLGGKVDLDMAEYAAWKAAHPNVMFDGIVVEWDNDLMMGYSRIDRIEDPVRRAQVRRFLGDRPADRHSRLQMMRKHLANRRNASYGGDMGAFVAHIYNLHLAGDCGAKYICIETTNTSGGKTDDSEYRWNTAAMFARGASRQFSVPWEWYVAGYMNGFRENGEWLNNSICTHPATAAGLPQVNGRPPPSKGPEFGVSANLLRRVFYFAYLNGANFTQMEEWSSQFQTWDAKAGRTVLTPFGRDYVRFHDFTRANPGRGTPFTPVAICVPISQGYSAYGGRPWCEGAFGYSRGDHEVDAVFFTLVPGFERAKAMKAGIETNLHNTPYAHMYDVLCPDSPGQSDAEAIDAMKSYKALVVVGDYADSALLERRLAAYRAAGGRVVRFGADAVPEPENASKTIGDIKSGRAKYPKVAGMFDALQAAYFPFKVKGDCLYGANRTKDGWWLWVFNNKGITKFADKMASVDHGYDVEISVSPAKVAFGSVRELLSGKPVAVTDGAFSHRIAAGDLAIFAITPNGK